VADVDLDIVALGNHAKSLGITPTENFRLTGKKPSPRHSSKGYHPHDEAIDFHDNRPDNAPEYEGGKPVHWTKRTAAMADRFLSLGILDEAIGPNQDPKGHGTHFHAALRGRKKVPRAFLDYGFTGRWQEQNGVWRRDNPLSFFGGAAGSGGDNATYQPLSGASPAAEPPPPPPKLVDMDPRADNSSANQRERATWENNQGLIQWAEANPELAGKVLAEHGFSKADLGPVKQVWDDDPRAIGRFKPENRGALAGTTVGGRRP
jgi:hypothetical protein